MTANTRPKASDMLLTPHSLLARLRKDAALTAAPVLPGRIDRNVSRALRVAQTVNGCEGTTDFRLH